MYGSGFEVQELGFRVQGGGGGLGQFMAQVSAVHLRWAQLGSFVDFGIRVRAHT